MRCSVVSLAYFLFLFMISPGIVIGDGIVKFDFTGYPGDQTATGLVWSSGQVVVGGGAVFRGTGLSPAVTPDSMSSTNCSTFSSVVLSESDYYSFAVTPMGNKKLNLTDLYVATSASSMGPSSFQLRTSLDNFASGSTTPTNSETHVTFGSGYSGLTGTIEFRIYGFNALSTNGIFSLVNNSTVGGLELDGTLVSVPEPATIVLLAVFFSFSAVPFLARTYRISARGH